MGRLRFRRFRTWLVVVATAFVLVVSGFGIAANPITYAQGPAEDTETQVDEVSDDCPIVKSTEFRWALCPVFGSVSFALKAFDAFITEYMTTGNQIFQSSINPDTGQTVENDYKKAWGTFRTFGIGLLIIAGLVMLISEALSLSIVDAYTVRKTLPRLLVAIIGISVSWEFCKFLIGLFDDLGRAIGSIIYTSFGVGTTGVDITTAIVSQLLVAGAATTAAIFLTGMGVISLLGTVLLAIMVAAVVLVLRQAIIVALVIASPLWIAAFVLPNTKKLADFCWDGLWRMLALYPILAGVIALCKSMGNITINQGGDSPLQTLISTLVGTVLFFLGYAAAPVAARATGGLVATLGGIANDRSRGAFDGLKNYRQGKVDRQKELYGRRVLQKRGQITSALQNAASKGARADGSRSVGRRAANFALRGMAGAVGGENVEAAMSARRAAVGKEIDDQIASGDDTEIRGLTVNKNWVDKYGRQSQRLADGSWSEGDYRISDGKRQYKSLGGAWIDEAAVVRGNQRWGNDTFAQQAALSYEMRKASTEEEIQGIAKNYRRVAQGIGLDANGVERRVRSTTKTGYGGWGNSDYAAGGNWIGSAFANQAKHLEYKRTNWKTGDLSAQTAVSNLKDDSVVIQRDRATGRERLLSRSAAATMAPDAQVETFDLGRSNQYVSEIYENKGSYPLAQMNSNSIEQLKRAYRATQVVTSSTAAGSAEHQAALDQQRKISAIAETFMHEISQPVRGADGKPVVDASGKPVMSMTRQSNAPGAAHVSERVWELSEIVGVRAGAPGTTARDPVPEYDRRVHGTSPNQRLQR